MKILNSGTYELVSYPSVSHMNEEVHSLLIKGHSSIDLING